MNSQSIVPGLFWQWRNRGMRISQFCLSAVHMLVRTWRAASREALYLFGTAVAKRCLDRASALICSRYVHDQHEVEKLSANESWLPIFARRFARVKWRCRCSSYVL